MATGAPDGGQSGTSAQTLTAMLVPIAQSLKQGVLPTVNKESYLTETIATRVEKHRGDIARHASEFDAFQSYFAARQLTRLPFPLAEIDLNVDDLDEVAVGGQIELSISIDEAGKVVDVSATEGGSESPVFVERVAKRFFDSRFSPGEINGQRVKSLLLISVISEPRSSAERF